MQPIHSTLIIIFDFMSHRIQTDKVRCIADYIFITGLPKEQRNRELSQPIDLLPPITDVGVINKLEHDVIPPGYMIIGS